MSTNYTLEELNDCSYNGKKFYLWSDAEIDDLGSELYDDESLFEKSNFVFSDKMLKTEINVDLFRELLETITDRRHNSKVDITQLQADLSKAQGGGKDTSKHRPTVDQSKVDSTAEKLKRARETNTSGETFLDQIKKRRIDEPVSENVIESETKTASPTQKSTKPEVVKPKPENETVQDYKIGNDLANALGNRRKAMEDINDTDDSWEDVDKLNEEQPETKRIAEKAQGPRGKLQIDNQGSVANLFKKGTPPTKPEATKPNEQKLETTQPVSYDLPPPIKAGDPAPIHPETGALVPDDLPPPMDAYTDLPPPIKMGDPAPILPVTDRPVPHDLPPPMNAINTDRLEQKNTKTANVEPNVTEAGAKQTNTSSSKPSLLTKEESESKKRFCDNYSNINKMYNESRKSSGNSFLKMFSGPNKNRELQIIKLQKCMSELNKSSDPDSFSNAVVSLSNTLADIKTELSKESRKLGDSGMSKLCATIENDFNTIAQQAQLHIKRDIENKKLK